MQLVEPGPQPPAFEVEYSVLQVDLPAADEPIEDPPQQEANHKEASVVEPAEVSAKPSAASGPTFPVASEETAAADAVSQSVTDSGDASTVSSGQAAPTDEPSDSDALGTGIEVSDHPLMPQTDSQPTADTNSPPTSTEPNSTNSSDQPNQKKGRPNRRRRSRRGQKKNDGPTAQGDS